MAEPAAASSAWPEALDARRLNFARLVGHLSSPTCLPRSQHVRDQLLNLFLHPSLYPPTASTTPIPASERWDYLAKQDPRAQAVAFGDVPRHLLDVQPGSTEALIDSPPSECWGLLLVTSPQNSLVPTPKSDPDPPIIDIWLSKSCEPETEGDTATRLVELLFARLIPAAVQAWLGTAFPLTTARQTVFGYALPREVVQAMKYLVQQGAIDVEVEFEHPGRAFLLAARNCWPHAAPEIGDHSGLLLTRVNNQDVELVWDGAHRNYSSEYISSRTHISCCLREIPVPSAVADTDAHAPAQALSLHDIDLQSKPIAWSLAHSALSIAATYVDPSWRSRPLRRGDPSEPPMRISDFIIRHISREIVQAKLHALWMCGLSSSRTTWAPTAEAPETIPDPFGENVSAAHDLLSVCAESQTENEAAYRMWARLGFDDLESIGMMEVSWIQFNLKL
ncbi:hypothetical protein V8E36_004646 [Tilletia maclaganii]